MINSKTIVSVRWHSDTIPTNKQLKPKNSTRSDYYSESLSDYTQNEHNKRIKLHRMQQTISILLHRSIKTTPHNYSRKFIEKCEQKLLRTYLKLKISTNNRLDNNFAITFKKIQKSMRFTGFYLFALIFNFILEAIRIILATQIYRSNNTSESCHQMKQIIWDDRNACNAYRW